MAATKSRTANETPRTYTSYEALEKAVFPKARRDRLRKEAQADPRDTIANSVLAVLRRHGASPKH